MTHDFDSEYEIAGLPAHQVKMPTTAIRVKGANNKMYGRTTITPNNSFTKKPMIGSSN